MQTIFIDRKNTQLAIEQGRLKIQTDIAHASFSLPLHHIDMLVISTAIPFSSNILTKLTQAGITSVFINARNANISTTTYGILHNNVERKLMQYQAISNPKQQMHYSQLLITQKIRGQRNMLKKALKQRPDCRHALSKSITTLETQLPQISQCKHINSLRGIEGAAAASYFLAYHQLFAPKLQFLHRNRRPPKDPVNVILSLTYTLLHAEAIRALCSIGFDPMLGIYHCPTFGRESLACDLVEIFRPMADRWIWRLFASETLRPEYFSETTNPNERPCTLGKKGREVFYSQYGKKITQWRKIMRNTCKEGLQLLQNSNNQVDNNG